MNAPLWRALVTGAADAAVRLRAPATAVTASPAVAQVTARRRRLLGDTHECSPVSLAAPRGAAGVGQGYAAPRLAVVHPFPRFSLNPRAVPARISYRTERRPDGATRCGQRCDLARPTTTRRDRDVPPVPGAADVLRAAADRRATGSTPRMSCRRPWSGPGARSGKLDLTEPSLMPWLATVARRIVIDDKRRKSVAAEPRRGTSMLENAPAADTTDDLLRKVVVAEALQSALGRPSRGAERDDPARPHRQRGGRGPRVSRSARSSRGCTTRSGRSGVVLAERGVPA